jgi:hypothetical protein
MSQVAGYVNGTASGLDIIPVSFTLPVTVTSAAVTPTLSCEVNWSTYTTATDANPAFVEHGTVSAVQVSSLGS